ncbi:MAG: hypothetical protein HY209_03640 [Candidatus Omnitrophica bacterium]|nr:hypothetical protein [Candidatus Omnitrophota bacterium]
MDIKKGVACLLCLLLVGCSKPQEPKEAVASINGYAVTLDEFEAGFTQSPFASREDKAKARKDYFNNLINQKLILQDAQQKNIDKDKEFLKSIEHFWEQSLLTVALGVKTKEIAGSLRISQENIRRLYDQMVKEGATTKSYEELYPQLKWQAQKQMESQALNDWIETLRKNAQIKVSKDLLKGNQ